jgi:aspartyl-tRNA(Asn)/glutamyl-tRNA(Gln) amidotransferase subunit C
MSLTLAEVQEIAQLARLELTAGELERYRGQLSAILDHVARLADLDTADIPPTSSVLPPETTLRPDQPRPGLGADVVIANAAESADDQFKVPPVFDEGVHE